MNRGITRRHLITAASGAVFASAQDPATPEASREIDAFYDRSVVIDALSVTDEWDETTFAAWKASGYTAIHTSLANRNFRVAMRDLSRWRDIFTRHANRLMLCLKAGDVARAKSEGKLGVFLGFQNGTIIDDETENLARLHAAGTRCIQLTYNSRNLLGDGCTERTNAGLSDFGVECVERMNQLGIIVDLSHCGEQTSADGIRFSKKPPAFTHTVCKAVYDHVRAKSDDLLRAISEKGGMTGIAALGYFVGSSTDASLDAYLRHIEHAVNKCGIDHVGLSTDFSLRGIEATETRESWYLPRLQVFKPAYRVRWPPWIPELDKPERFRTVTQVLVKRGYKTVDIEKILGGNWVRYFREVLGG